MAKTESQATTRAVSYYLFCKVNGIKLSIRGAAEIAEIAPSTLTRALKRRKATTKPPKEQA